MIENISFHKDSFKFETRKLKIPKGLRKAPKDSPSLEFKSVFKVSEDIPEWKMVIKENNLKTS